MKKTSAVLSIVYGSIMVYITTYYIALGLEVNSFLFGAGSVMPAKILVSFLLILAAGVATIVMGAFMCKHQSKRVFAIISLCLIAVSMLIPLVLVYELFRIIISLFAFGFVTIIFLIIGLVLDGKEELNKLTKQLNSPAGAEVPQASADSKS